MFYLITFLVGVAIGIFISVMIVKRQIQKNFMSNFNKSNMEKIMNMVRQNSFIDPIHDKDVVNLRNLRNKKQEE